MKSSNIKKIMCSVIAGTFLLASCSLRPAEEVANETDSKKETTADTKAETNSSVANKIVPMTSSSNASSNSMNNSNSMNVTDKITKSGSNVQNNLNISNTSVPEDSQAFLELPLPDKDSVSGKALDKFIEGLKTMKSNRAEYTWTREGEGNKLKGIMIFDTLYKEGAPDIIKTKQQNFDNPDSETPSSTNVWYRNLEKFMVEEEGVFKSHPAAETEDTGNYDFSGLVTKALSFQEAVEDDMDYTVSIQTDNEAFIRETMGLLGYVRDGANDWKADMTMEIILDKETGHAKSVNYAVTNKETGAIDTGSVIFSDVDAIEEFTMPEEGSPAEGDASHTTTTTENHDATIPEGEPETEAEHSEYVPEDDGAYEEE